MAQHTSCLVRGQGIHAALNKNSHISIPQIQLLIGKKTKQKKKDSTLITCKDTSSPPIVKGSSNKGLRRE